MAVKTDFTAKLAEQQAQKKPTTLGGGYTIGPATELPLGKIRTEGGTQARASTDPATVEAYAEALRDGAIFPPIVVYHDGEAYWLADGFHRVAAHRHILKPMIVADVRQGTRREAVLYAVGANASHGLRRTRADVQRAIDTLLRDEEWGKWNNSEIARRVGCNDKTVAAARERLSSEIPNIANTPRLVERGGATYEQAARKPVVTDAVADVEADNEAMIRSLLKKAEAWEVGSSGRTDLCKQAYAVARMSGARREAMMRLIDTVMDGQAETTSAEPAEPAAPTGWRWFSAAGKHKLVSDEGWHTNLYFERQRAIAEAAQISAEHVQVLAPTVIPPPEPGETVEYGWQSSVEYDLANATADLNRAAATARRWLADFERFQEADEEARYELKQATKNAMRDIVSLFNALQEA